LASGGTGFDLDSVDVRFGELEALKQVSLSVATGESVAVVGPSGAGKTTLLRLLNGSIRPTSGQVSVGGRALDSVDGRELRELRSRIGFVHQDLRLVPTLRVVKNVLAGRLGSWSWAASVRRMVLPPRALVLEAHALLEQVGIEEKLFERTDRLSGGQQQRVAVARALFQRPDALLADEPVASVDPERARDTVGLFVDVCRERGLTLLMSLHDIELARESFPRLVGLRGGRVVFDRPTNEVGESELLRLYALENSGARRNRQAES
jgi:phosphonate transport system ATP-binding protein